jgi:hypothetical protein
MNPKQREANMPITLDIPHPLAARHNSLPNPQRFGIGLLARSVEGGLSQDQWWTLLEDIEGVAVDTGVTDLAERRDRYLGAT